MGGGNKQNQRTKGNVKPSSSSRAAEMLVQDGKTGFIGFGTLPETAGNSFGYVPKSIIGNEEDEHDIDPELRMLMRKMSKKDTITRLKAVQEFSQMCLEKPTEEVVKVLAFWPKIYNKLSEDYDHRVREATQMAHLEIVSRVGRKLAPQLKRIMSSWLKSQFDQFPPAASAARKAFNVTFPENKKRDAISFCKQDLLLNIYDILITQTKDTVSDPRNVPEEEREAKYNRLVSSTLLSMAFIMESLSKEDTGQIAEQYQNIFQEKKFWKFSKHASSMECWMHVNARKAILPKLWMVLRNGGFGNAATIFHNILPFLSKIPQSVIGEGPGFAKEFFTNIKEGLFNERVIATHSESIAVMTAYMECLRYTLFSCADKGDAENEDQRETIEYLINNEIKVLLENFLGDKKCHWKRTFISAVKDMILYLERQESQGNAGYYSQDMLKMIRELIRDSTLEAIHFEHAADGSLSLKKTFKNLEEMIKIIIFDIKPLKKEQKKKVVFTAEGVIDSKAGADGSSFDGNERTTEEVKIVQNQSDSKNTYTNVSLSEWEKLVLKDVCFNCIELLFKRKNLLYLEILSEIVSCVEGKNDFENMLTNIMTAKYSLLEESKRQENIGNYSDTNELDRLGDGFIEKVLLPVMDEGFPLQDSYWSSTDCQVAVIDLLCRLVVLLEGDSKQECLMKVIKISSKPFMFCKLVEKVLDTEDIDVVRLCFKRGEIWPKLINFLSSYFDGTEGITGDSSSLNEIFSCLELCLFFREGTLCQSEETECLFDIFKKFLKSCTVETMAVTSNEILCLLGKFFENANPSKELPKGTVDLLVASFQFLVNVGDSDARAIAEKTVKAGMFSLLHSSNFTNQASLESFLQKTAYWVQTTFKNTVDRQKLKRLAGCCSTIVNYLHLENHPSSTTHCVQTFLTQLVGGLRRQIDTQSVYSKPNVFEAVLLGQLSIYNLPKNQVSDRIGGGTNLSSASFAVSLICHLERLDSQQTLLLTAILDSLNVLCTVDHHLNGERKPKEVDQESSLTSDSVCCDIKELMTKETFPVKDLVNYALERSLENGGIDALALERLLSLLPQAYMFDNPISDLLGQALSGCENGSSSVDGLKIVLANVNDLSIARAMVEQYVDQLGNGASDCTFGFNRCIDLCITTLVNWQNMLQRTKDMSNDFSDVIASVVTALVEWRDKSNDVLLFSADLHDATDEQLALNVNLMRLLSFILDCGGAKSLAVNHWDFILCGLASWIQTCEDNADTLTESSRFSIFSFWAFNLCSSVSKAFDVAIGTEGNAENPTLISNTSWTIDAGWSERHQGRLIEDGLLTEWQEFFTPAIFKGVYCLYQHMLGKSSTANSEVPPYLLNAVCNALIRMPSTLLVNILLDTKTVEEALRQGSDLDSSQSEGRSFNDSQAEVIKEMFCIFIDQLKSEVCCLQVTAYALLCKLMLVARSAVLSMTSEAMEEDEYEAVRCIPEKQHEVLAFCQMRLLEYIDDTALGFGSYVIESPPRTLSHCYLAFLLSWQITLTQFRDAEPDKRAGYANFFRQRNMTGPLLKIVYSILPHDEGNLLSAEPVFIEGGELTLHTLRQCAFHVYLSALECIPAVIRSWCNNNLDKKSAIILERFTTAFASPILCSREIEQVSKSSKTFTNMAIKTRPAAREVVALYTVEEISMELVVKMSQSHPIGTVAVDCGKRVGVSSAQWRQWMLQLTMFLTQQNGTIVDGLSLWKRNVDKKFEGVEECMICFSVVHGTNYQLPTITCRVCKKKYHSACLYKWFSTSNKSTCPLCRNSF